MTILVIGMFTKKRINDETLAVYVNDELQSSIPKKGDALFKKAICDNDVKVSWDNDTWSLKVSNLKIKTKCNLYFYEGQTVFNFDYTGDEQTFTAPFSGTFKLETWGAQGSTNLGTNGKTAGGYGGYSVGILNLKRDNNIYINVGQNYNTTGEKLAAYNGGGIGDMSGGGATHIAFSSGELYTLENNINKIIIVSGGGGGEDTCPRWSTATETMVSGSGGGFYGGGSGDDAYYSSGGGGSGYIGNSLLTNKVMYCYNCEESTKENTKTISTTCNEETPTENCAKKGNGYARITLISIDE